MEAYIYRLNNKDPRKETKRTQIRHEEHCIQKQRQKSKNFTSNRLPMRK